jgi:hypothetical protein
MAAAVNLTDGSEAVEFVSARISALRHTPI